MSIDQRDGWGKISDPGQTPKKIEFKIQKSMGQSIQVGSMASL